MVEEFKDWLTENGKSASTIQTYLLKVGQYMKWYRETFGAEMTILLHGNILEYRSYLQNVKKHRATGINAKLSALISLDSFLTETRRQRERAISKKDLLRTQSAYASPGELTEKDVDAFRQAVLLQSGKRDHALVTILAYAGLRISEALTLSLDDVDLIGQQITVNKGKGNKAVERRNGFSTYCKTATN